MNTAATTTGNATALRTADRAAYLICSDDPAEVTAGLRLAFALPRELRTEILAGVEYYLADDEPDEAA
ncbi:hypothetical protein HNR23_003405 [Nocardiopsis mwathae]|uniref:Uncharacterized protein n=1 Tax=Nocardiopsis mwathae TaxID=1472723 RepID=A0A7W9YEP9_9ACTN|nr:hypothetical protein [Nocardiopsis mwathae]MBB6170714.1 hypothetical protein [Nocardiopsis mwathae]MBB6172315.1 hypothetical protein [Nocardiopsis mwathae]MBB6173345.1 hypothetical protein [Nocardiopsis mwathae]